MSYHFVVDRNVISAVKRIKDNVVSMNFKKRGRKRKTTINNRTTLIFRAVL